MPDETDAGRTLPPEIRSHYERAEEQRRLTLGPGRLEFARTQELLERFLPPPPAVVLDVGGGAGVHACPLAARGYTVCLVDPVPLHLDQARAASARQPTRPLAGIAQGDARRLTQADASVEAVLLLGPLYHLTSRDDRLRALGEARRVLVDGGVLMAAGISRFASMLDGLARGLLDDPSFASIVAADLADGQHRNPAGAPDYFTTAFFHQPEELRAEVAGAGLEVEALLGVEGPAWMLQDFDRWWEDPARRSRLLGAVRAIEAEPSLLGASAHIMAVGRRRPEGGRLRSGDGP